MYSYRKAFLFVYFVTVCICFQVLPYYHSCVCLLSPKSDSHFSVSPRAKLTCRYLLGLKQFWVSSRENRLRISTELHGQTSHIKSFTAIVSVDIFYLKFVDFTLFLTNSPKKWQMRLLCHA